MKGGSVLRLSETGILPNHPIIAIENIWIDGQRYDLADDGDTLLPRQPRPASLR